MRRARGIVAAIALALGTTLVSAALASPALAAPPANDDFGSAQDLGNGASATASGINTGATVEPGEPDSAPGFTTRATVWYRWMAPNADLVLVDVCGASFSDGVAVFTGTSVDSLTEVTKGGLGNPCQVSFTPTAGTIYRIGVDGILGQTGTFSLALEQGGQLFALNVEKGGAGSGTVTSSPSGIDCGYTCQRSYVPSAVVTLTASPASDSTFAGWSGDCSGTGTCEVTM